METLYGKMFEDTIKTAAQQMESKFRDKVEVESGLKGKSKSFGWLNASAAREKTVRHSDVIRDDPGENRVTAYMRYFYKDISIDTVDKLKTLGDLNSPSVKTVSGALRRQLDDLIIVAATATKYTGENGTVESAWDTDQDVDTVATYVSTLDQWLAALELLDNGNNDEEEEKFVMISPRVRTALLNVAKLTSADYQTLQALVPGKFTEPILGFKWGVSNRLPFITGTTRGCLAWIKSGIGLGLWEDIKTRVRENPDKHFEWEVYANLSAAATRIEDCKVVRIKCDESLAVTAQ